MSYLDAAAKIISEFEGLRLDAYLCPAKVWTIGYGHTEDVKEGDRITAEQALELLYGDMLFADRAIDELAKVPLRENERAALVSFIFNVGRSAFRSSTMLRKLNGGDYEGAAAEFPRWDKAGGKQLPGLARRRLAEQQLFRA